MALLAMLKLRKISVGQVSRGLCQGKGGFGCSLAGGVVLLRSAVLGDSRCWCPQEGAKRIALEKGKKKPNKPPLSSSDVRM